jgi:DNA-binding response OmpR family regulator
MVLEDEASIRSFIVINLRRAGYEVVEAETGEEALDKLHANPDTLVALLDVMLPGIDGFEVCRRIRATNPRIGIIMLTARSQEMDKVTGLMNGADDYVTKPFSPAELTARVDALIRRSGQPRTPGGHHQPAPLPAEHPQPHPGEKRPAHQADPGGVFHHADVYGKSRQGPVPGGDPGPGVGPGLFRRAEDRGRQRPPSAAEDRGQRHQPHLYHHGVGLWL